MRRPGDHPLSFADAGLIHGVISQRSLRAADTRTDCAGHIEGGIGGLSPWPGLDVGERSFSRFAVQGGGLQRSGPGQLRPGGVNRLQKLVRAAHLALQLVLRRGVTAWCICCGRSKNLLGLTAYIRISKLLACCSSRYESSLSVELADRNSTGRILRCRVAWLVGRWVAKVRTPSSFLLGHEVLVHLLDCLVLVLAFFRLRCKRELLISQKLCRF